MPTALITGGAGFIGSHLANHLIEHGWRVRILDDLSTGKSKNLAPIAGQIDFREGSVLDDSVLVPALSGCEAVFHLAAMVSVPRSVAEPLECHDRCATATLKVLEAAAQAGVRRLVFSASSSAYGGVTQCPIDERAPVRALSPYAAAKLAGEHYCTAYAELGKLETVRLRYFNVFGPRQDPSSPYSGVISIFITKLLQGDSPTIFGDGLQSRDFVFATDVAEANRLAATVPEANGQAFNIGRGSRVTLLELLETLNRVMGRNVAARFAAPRAGDVRDSQADISLARRILGFDPKVPLAEGLAECVRYYEQELASPDR